MPYKYWQLPINDVDPVSGRIVDLVELILQYSRDSRPVMC